MFKTRGQILRFMLRWKAVEFLSILKITRMCIRVVDTVIIVINANLRAYSDNSMQGNWLNEPEERVVKTVC